MPFVYIVACSDGTLYTGWAVDPAARVRAHNAGRGSVYCKRRRPVHLVYQEEAPNRTSAQSRELEIKGMRRCQKLALISRGRRADDSLTGDGVAHAVAMRALNADGRGECHA